MKPHSLSDLIAKQRSIDIENFKNSPSKDSNEYYEAKKERIKQGIEEEISFDNEDEFD